MKAADKKTVEEIVIILTIGSKQCCFITEFSVPLMMNKIFNWP